MLKGSICTCRVVARSFPSAEDSGAPLAGQWESNGPKWLDDAGSRYGRETGRDAPTRDVA